MKVALNTITHNLNPQKMFIVYKSVHIINYQTTFIILDKILDVLFLYTTKYFIFSATGKIQKSSVLWGERLCFWDWEETKTY